MPGEPLVEWFAMRSFCTVGAIVALLASFIEAPYFHLHGDPESDHVRKHHHGKSLTAHSHFSIPQHHTDGLPAMQSRADGEDYDAIFLAQASSLTRVLLLPAFLPENAIQSPLPDPVRNLVLRPAYRSHDPPVIPALSARPPPA